jgi:hypothetical protein
LLSSTDLPACIERLTFGRCVNGHDRTGS